MNIIIEIEDPEKSEKSNNHDYDTDYGYIEICDCCYNVYNKSIIYNKYDDLTLLYAKQYNDAEYLQPY